MMKFKVKKFVQQEKYVIFNLMDRKDNNKGIIIIDIPPIDRRYQHFKELVII